MNILYMEDVSNIILNFSKDLIEKVDGLIKFIVLFGSYARNENKEDSDIDLLIVVDDVNPEFKNTSISFYYDNLNEILKSKEEYKKLHITTLTLSVFYDGVLKGDPLIINTLRVGIPIIDTLGFFKSLQELLKLGKIKNTEEAVLELKNKYNIEKNLIMVNLYKTLESIYLSILYLSQYLLLKNNIDTIEPEKIYEELKKILKDNGISNKEADTFKELYEYVKSCAKNSSLLDFEKVLDLYYKSEDLEKILLNIVEKNKQ